MMPTQITIDDEQLVPVIHVHGVSMSSTSAGPGLDLVLHQADCMVLTGRSGDDRKALAQAILGRGRPARGKVQVFGADPWACSGAVRAAIGVVDSGCDVDAPRLRIEQVFRYWERNHPAFSRPAAERVLAAAELPLSRKLGALTLEEARLVQLAIALAAEPALLVFIEPLEDLDTSARERFLRIFLDYSSERATSTLIIANDPHPFESLATHAAVVSGGQLLLTEPLDALRADAREYVLQVPAHWVVPVELRTRSQIQSQHGELVELLVWGESVSAHAVLMSGADVIDTRPVTLARFLNRLLERVS